MVKKMEYLMAQFKKLSPLFSLPCPPLLISSSLSSLSSPSLPLLLSFSLPPLLISPPFSPLLSFSFHFFLLFFPLLPSPPLYLDICPDRSMLLLLDQSFDQSQDEFHTPKLVGKGPFLQANEAKAKVLKSFCLDFGIVGQEW